MKANMGRARARASQIYCVVRGYFFWRETEEKISAMTPKRIFQYFFIPYYFVEEFYHYPKFLFFPFFFFQEGLGVNWKKKNTLLQNILATNRLVKIDTINSWWFIPIYLTSWRAFMEYAKIIIMCMPVGYTHFFKYTFYFLYLFSYIVMLIFI